MFKRIFSSIPGLIVICSFAAAAFKIPAFARSESLEFSRPTAHATISSGHGGRVTQISGDSVIERGFSAKSGNLLEVDLKTGGEIDVTGWDNDSIAVVATLEDEDCADARISFEESSAGLLVASSYPSKRGRRNYSCNANMEIKVPHKQALRFSTMGGDIHVDGVEGDIQGKTMGGGLELSNLKGELSLTTMGGDIELTNSHVDGSVKTMGGKVLLEDVVGGVKGESMGGNVIYRRVTNKKGESSGDEVRIKTMGGDINVDEALDGADVHTMGGAIRIKSARKHVKALTMGGEIDIREIDGSVDATTMGGDIEVTMIGNPGEGDRGVSLKSYGGDITLIVPEGLSMDLDLSLAFTRKHEGDYHIESDFPLAKKTSKEWEYGHGDPRKFIYGTGAVQGGKNRVVIETINGNIILKKGSARGRSDS